MEGKGWRIVPVEEEHVRWLAPRMRKADREEVASSAGFGPAMALLESVSAPGEHYTMLLRGKVALIFGVASTDADLGVIWALGSDVVSAHPKLFWQASKAAIEELKKKYRVLLNAVHHKNAASLRWVKRLGFTVREPRPFGKKGELFYPITWEADDV